MVLPPAFANVTTLAALVLAGTAPWSANASRAPGVRVTCGAVGSRGAVHVPAGPPPMPGPFSKMVNSLLTNGVRPSQLITESAPSARLTSAGTRPENVTVQFVEPAAS